MNNKQNAITVHGYYGSKNYFFDNQGCVTTVIDMKKNCQKSFQGEVANQN
jgi:hypothetical protein